MQVTKNSIETMAGPSDWFTGAVYVDIEPGEDHWHGAAPGRFMTHLAMLDVDEEGNRAAWGDHVTDEEYESAAAR